MPPFPNNPALWQRPVLIGTAETLAALAGQLAVTDLLPSGATCLLASPAEAASLGLHTGADLAGIPIAGTLGDLSSLHARAPWSVALVSLPARERALAQRVRALLRESAIPERFIPALQDQLVQASGATPLGASINMAELVGRTPYGVDRRSVRAAIEAKRVLITGAGGSIGSELARIASTFQPSMIILMERSENALFDIDRAIARRFPGLPRRAILHDVVDSAQTMRHLAALKPHVVFHAAAHKHVPLMEEHPGHALTNNLFGTRSIADAALAAGAERFVMISTDKAVNPSSMMGATKRLAEMYVRWCAQTQNLRAGRAATRCSIVRFGNVLGSACSVLPIWTQQMCDGGPVTVTDARMTRYFMTIPEAATLVIQAGASDDGPPNAAAVHVLDMGEPVRILDLASRFVRMHGYEPRTLTKDGADATNSALTNANALASVRDVAQGHNAQQLPIMDITLTGARPGEKLHEELAYATEALLPTDHPGIFALREDAPLPDMASVIDELRPLCQHQDAALVKAVIRRHLGIVHTPLAAAR